MENKRKKILVTGGAGFIGSNLVRALNELPVDVTIVDDLTDGRKFKNLVGSKFNYVDSDYFWTNLDNLFYGDAPDFVFHLGAISSTSFPDGKILMENNVEKSKRLIRLCTKNKIGIHFASSASIYGNNFSAREIGTSGYFDHLQFEPLNAYAFSKYRVDQFIESLSSDRSKYVTSLRYFNVFGPGEQHKDGQSSPVYKFWKDIQEKGVAEVFDVHSSRDFIHVRHVVAKHIELMNEFFKDGQQKHLFLDVGMGIPTSFDMIASWVISVCNSKTKPAFAYTSYIPFPRALLPNYQFYTCAQRNLSFEEQVKTSTQLEQDVVDYVKQLDAEQVRIERFLLPINRTELEEKK